MPFLHSESVVNVYVAGNGRLSVILVLQKEKHLRYKASSNYNVFNVNSYGLKRIS